MSEIDTSAEAVERLAREHDDTAQFWVHQGGHEDSEAFHRTRAATLRALLAERDAALAQLDRLRGPQVDIEARRAGLLAAGISERTVDAMLASPAYDREHRTEGKA